MKINGLHHVAYAVNDYKTVYDFWKKLGFTLLHNQAEPEEETETVLWIGQVQIQLHPTKAVLGAARWRSRHTRDDLYQMCLEVESIEEAMKTLEAAGIELLQGPEDTIQGREIYIDRKYTGEYDLGFIELRDSLKGKSLSCRQKELSRLLGMVDMLPEKIAYNHLGMTNIHHIGISVADYGRARHLWQDVLGFDALYQHFKERDFKEDAMYLGDAQIHLYRSDNPDLKFCWWPKENGDGMETLSVCVDKINRAIQALRVEGIDIAGDGPESMSQGMDVFIDKKYTGGNDFELVEMHYFLRGKSVEEMKKIIYHFFGEGSVL